MPAKQPLTGTRFPNSGGIGSPRALSRARGASVRLRNSPDVELMRQRVFGIACCYGDGNDAARLTDDVIPMLMVGRDPIGGAPPWGATTAWSS